MFAKWFKGRRKAQAEPKGPSIGDVPRIVAAYGSLLETPSAEFMDVSVLPVPKEQMKVALKIAWIAERDEKRKEAIEGSFVYLSSFQESVGPTPFQLRSDPNILMTKDGRARVELAARLSRAAAIESGKLLADFIAFKADMRKSPRGPYLGKAAARR